MLKSSCGYGSGNRSIAEKLFSWFGGGGINGTSAYGKAATTSDSFNAVAEPRRREILNYLALQERAVGDIVVGLKMAQSSVSKHLRVLRNVGLVRLRRNGRHVFYRTNAEAIRPLHEWTKTFEALWQHLDSRERARRRKAEIVGE